MAPWLACIAGLCILSGCASARITLSSNEPDAKVTIIEDGKATRLVEQTTVRKYTFPFHAGLSQVEISAEWNGKPPDEVWIVGLDYDDRSILSITQFSPGTEKIELKVFRESWYSVHLIWKKPGE